MAMTDTAESPDVETVEAGRVHLVVGPTVADARDYCNANRINRHAATAPDGLERRLRTSRRANVIVLEGTELEEAHIVAFKKRGANLVTLADSE